MGNKNILNILNSRFFPELVELSSYLLYAVRKRQWRGGRGEGYNKTA